MRELKPCDDAGVVNEMRCEAMLDPKSRQELAKQHRI